MFASGCEDWRADGMAVQGGACRICNMRALRRRAPRPMASVGKEGVVSRKPADVGAIAPAAVPERSGRLKRAATVLPPWVLALLFYLLMALLTIGRYAIAHPRSVCACMGNGDTALFMWGLTWWPHAIMHGLNPFVSHYLWPPVGVNTARATLLPTAAIVLAPFTALFGQIFSYNILSIGSPALAAFTTYLLCRRLVRRELPAVAGGYLFGFGSYELVQLTGHLNLTLVFLIPVMVHVALRRIDRELSRRTYVIVMALLLILQAGLSTELLAECVAFGAVLLGSARLLAPQPQRSRVSGLIGETVGAGALALLVASPFFYYALFSGGLPTGRSIYWEVYGLDLLNLVFPTSTTWLGHHAFLAVGLSYEIGNINEADGYLSIPLLIIFMLWLTGRERGRTLVRLLAVVAGVSLVIALGAHLHIAGHRTMALPGDLVKSSSFFNNFIPSRMILFTTLAVSVGVAAWLAMPVGRMLGRWLVVLLVAVMIFPNATRSLYGVSPRNPRFFSTALYHRYLKPGETVLALPFGAGDQSAFWQAETGFYFYMPGGYLSNFIPPSFASLPIMNQLISNSAPSPTELWLFIRQHYVSHVVIDAGRAGFWPETVTQLGLYGRPVGGVLLYTVPNAPA